MKTSIWLVREDIALTLITTSLNCILPQILGKNAVFKQCYCFPEVFLFLDILLFASVGVLTFEKFMWWLIAWVWQYGVTSPPKMEERGGDLILTVGRGRALNVIDNKRKNTGSKDNPSARKHMRLIPAI